MRRSRRAFRKTRQEKLTEKLEAKLPVNEQEFLLDGSLPATLSYLYNSMGNSHDFIVRRLHHRGVEEVGIAICYIDGLVDQQLLSKLINDVDNYLPLEWLEHPKEWVAEKISAGDVKKVYTGNELLTAVLGGAAAVMVNGVEGAAVVPISGGQRRSVEEPSSQTVIRGPKEGFTESLSTNLALIRRKIRSPHLRFTNRTIGRYTQTQVTVGYIDGLANPVVVEEVLNRLDAIDTDSILESGYIEEFIQDKTLTPFPTISNTERPDMAAASLLEGQVVILVDGSPFVLVCPVTFFRFFLSSEDYYQRYDISSFLRNIRLFSFFVALLLPSLYIAVTTFHPEMLPTTMLISLAAQREGTPLPALLEAFLMEITFEVIREAGVRMPRVIGSAISIVGALVLGQAAVQAGLVSAAMVIIVSFTAIANFVIPMFAMSAAIRLIRFGLMLLAGSFGVFGILAGIIPILFHLCSLTSFGVPYFLPLAPFSLNNMKDVFIRVPWPKMNKRPSYISVQNMERQGSEGSNSKEGRS